MTSRSCAFLNNVIGKESEGACALSEELGICAT